MEINRIDWPSAGPHRTFLELLDRLHREHGEKSYQQLSEDMAAASGAPGLAVSRIHTILRGKALPTGHAQVRLAN